jgi:hypothetical protein
MSNPFEFHSMMSEQHNWQFPVTLDAPFRVEAANKVFPSIYRDGWLILDREGRVSGPYRMVRFEVAVERCDRINLNAARRIMVQGTKAEDL